jgi:hypothetical protein
MVEGVAEMSVRAAAENDRARIKKVRIASSFALRVISPSPSGHVRPSGHFCVVVWHRDAVTNHMDDFSRGIGPRGLSSQHD